MIQQCGNPLSYWTRLVEHGRVRIERVVEAVRVRETQFQTKFGFPIELACWSLAPSRADVRPLTLCVIGSCTAGRCPQTPGFEVTTVRDAGLVGLRRPVRGAADASRQPSTGVSSMLLGRASTQQPERHAAAGIKED